MINESQEDLEKNYKKLYYETKNSTQKIYPYYVRFENENQARQTIQLLNDLGFENVKVPNVKSFNLYVNLEFKRYSHPNIAFWYMGCKDYLSFEQFNDILQNYLNSAKKLD